ncbi:hypothetical protein ACFQ2Y_05235 [Streptomyces malaysiensis subsp. malaysiensis]
MQTIECVMGAHGADAVQIAELTRGETGEQFEIIDTGPEQCIGQTMSDSVVSEDIEKLAPSQEPQRRPGAFGAISRAPHTPHISITRPFHRALDQLI